MATRMRRTSASDPDPIGRETRAGWVVANCRQNGDPTPGQIYARKAAIRREWTPSQEQSRRATKPRPAPLPITAAEPDLDATGSRYHDE